MIRPLRVAWLLLLLFVLGRQRWGAVAEERTGAHSVAHCLAHTGPHFVAHTGEHDSGQSEKLVRGDSTGKKLREKKILNEKPRHFGTDAVELNFSLEGSEDELNSNSRLADFPCPDAAAIAPCVCTVDGDNNVDLDCTFVESEEQLDLIFQQEFPVKELHGFYMHDNIAIRVLGNGQSGVSFEIIDLYPGPFALQSISEYFLLDSRLTLNSAEFYNSKLLSDGFPFAILVAMETLDDLTIEHSNFTWIPKLNSPTIKELSFTYGSIDVIEPGTFDDVTNLSVLALYFNALTELRGGTMPLREGAMEFYCHSNNIYVIEPGTFFFVDAASAASSESLYIDLSFNQLQSLQAGTFPLRISPVDIRLNNNQIASVEPGTFVLPEAAGAASSGSLYIDLRYNQLQSLQAGTFPLGNSSFDINLNYNQIASIEPGTFVLPEATGAASSGSFSIQLADNQVQSLQAGTFPMKDSYNNQIASIEPGTFVLPEATDSFSLILSLTDNLLMTVDEAVFGDVMPFIDLRLYGNPLSSGCDISWLVLSEELLAKIDPYATCADGTYLQDHDPKDFVDFC